jgi:hypothetical protein
MPEPEPRVRLLDSSGTAQGSFFFDGTDVIIEESSAGNSIKLGDGGDLVFEDGNGTIQNVTSPADLQTLTGSPVPAGSDVQIPTVGAIVDEAGVKRLFTTNSATDLRTGDGDVGVRAEAGFSTRLFARSGEFVGIRDAKGDFRALEYTASSSAPGTLELSNSRLEVRAGTLANGALAVRPDLSKPGGTSSATLRIGSEGAGFFIDGAGDIGAIDNDGNVTILT